MSFSYAAGDGEGNLALEENPAGPSTCLEPCCVVLPNIQGLSSVQGSHP